MKKLLVVLCVFAAGAMAQTSYQAITVYPYPNPSTVDSATVSSTSDTVKVYTIIPDSVVTVAGTKISVLGGTPFAGILTGMRLKIYGVSADSAVWVTVNTGDSVLTINASRGIRNRVSIICEQASATFKGVTVGFPIMGTNIPNGTVVTAAVDSFSFVVNKRATATATRTATIYSGTYKGTQSAYATGELVGIPFTFYLPHSPGLVFDGVEILDSSAQTANLDVVLYDAAVIGYSADNAAYAPGGASFDNVVGYATITTFKAIGTNTSLGFVTGLAQPLPAASGGWYYGVLLSRGSGNFLGNRTLKVKLLFKE